MRLDKLLLHSKYQNNATRKFWNGFNSCYFTVRPISAINRPMSDATFFKKWVWFQRRSSLLTQAWQPGCMGLAQEHLLGCGDKAIAPHPHCTIPQPLQQQDKLPCDRSYEFHYVPNSIYLPREKVFDSQTMKTLPSKNVLLLQLSS